MPNHNPERSGIDTRDAILRRSQMEEATLYFQTIIVVTESIRCEEPFKACHAVPEGAMV